MIYSGVKSLPVLNSYSLKYGSDLLSFLKENTNTPGLLVYSSFNNTLHSVIFES